MRRTVITIGLALALAACDTGIVATPAPSLSPAPVPSASPEATGAPATESPPPTTASPAPSASIAPSPTPEVTAEPSTAPPPPSPTPKPTPRPSKPPSNGPTLAQLVGQKLVIRMTGTSPSDDLLGRVRRGEVGGVILFGANVSTPDGLVSLTSRLQAAARAGGQPPLLIATDQEGGEISRIPWAPPTLTPPEMGATGLASTARAQGEATGAALLALGINCDLAPVADVPGSTSSFMFLEGRTWSFDAATTASLSNAFALGLRSADVLPVLKHFPGIGFATLHTDTHVVTIGETAEALQPGLQPYVAAIDHHLPLIMLSNATYPAYDSVNGAGWSRAIVQTLLRGELGFRGVTITNSLSGTAKARGVPAVQLAITAATAGTDMIMLTGPESATAAAYEELLARAKDGTIPRSRLEASYARIVALKNGL